MKIAILNRGNGRWLRAVDGGNDAGLCFVDRDDVGPDETWEALFLPDAKLAFRSRTGRFLSAENAGGGAVHANRHELGPWERWMPTDGGGLMSEDGRHYLCAELQTESVPITATRTARGPWETWQLRALENYRVRPAGTDWQLENGQPFTWCGATSFLLFQRFLEGQDIEPLLYAGFNLYRVTSLMSFLSGVAGLRPLTPANYSGYWDALPRFADYLAERGKRFELTIFADAQVLMPELAHQAEHAAQVCDVLRDKGNVFFELANEPFKNGVDPRKWVGLATSAPYAMGSAVDGMALYKGGTYATFHPRRDWKWPFTIAQTTNELQQTFAGPIVHNEPIGADETDQPGKRSTDAESFYKMALDALLWSAGVTFHSQAGTISVPLGPTQEACAEAFQRGVVAGAAT